MFSKITLSHIANKKLGISGNAKPALSRGITSIIALMAIFVNSFLGVFIAPTPVSASTQDFSFDSFTADYYLTKNPDDTAHLKVREKLVANFPSSNQNHGIERYIPTTNDNGRGVTVRSKSSLNFSVKRNGRDEPFSISREDDSFRVRIGNASEYVHGTQTYVLEYEFDNAILGYTSAGISTYDPEAIRTEGLYWDTNGTGWSQTFGELTARVHLEPDAIDQLTGDVSCYVGRFGTKGSERCIIAKTNGGYEFSTGELSSHENLTFNLEFKKDAFSVKIKQNPWLIVITSALLVATIGFVILAISKYSKLREKRDFYKTSPTPPEYTPPKLSLHQASLIYPKRLKSDKVANLIHLAVHHKIELVKSEKKLGRTNWSINVKDLSGVTNEEMAVLKMLNHGVEPSADDQIIVKSQSYNTAVASIARSYDRNAFKGLKERGLFEEKASETILNTPAKITLILALSGFLIMAFIGLLSELTEMPGALIGEEYLPGFCIILIPLMVTLPIIITWNNGFYKQHTMEGLKTVVYLNGLKLYMQMAEADRIKFLQSVDGADTTTTGIVKLYEKLLPYAILFGMENTWLAELSRYYQMPDVENPDWYSGTDILLFNELHAFNVATSRSISSGSISSDSSSSSGSSGGGGGGFSGGGGGGGGGGGW